MCSRDPDLATHTLFTTLMPLLHYVLFNAAFTHIELSTLDQLL